MIFSDTPQLGVSQSYSVCAPHTVTKMLGMTARTYAIFSRGTDLATEHILRAFMVERCIRNIN